MTSFPCPSCGGDAVVCGCDGLSIQDQSRIIAALQYDFTSLDHAMDVVCETVDSNSLLHTAAMQFIIINAPEGVREIISKAFEKVFKVQPDYRGPDGERLYSTALAAQVFGISIDEMQRRAEAMLPASELRYDHGDVSRVQ